MRGSYRFRQGFAYNLRFPGQYYDAETGLSQNMQRDFDPLTGRYVESDPIGLAGGVNTYAYANANPGMLVDLLGLAASCRNDDRCAQLRRDIFSKSALLLKELTKYDPIADGRGGFPTAGGGTTVPGGHYTEMTQLQQVCGLGMNVRGGTRPRLSCGRSSLYSCSQVSVISRTCSTVSNT